VHDSTGTIEVSNFFTIEIPATGPLLVATKSLPVGCADCSYDFDLQAAGGTTPYSHDLVANPDGGAGWVVLDTQVTPSPQTETEADQSIDRGAFPPPGLTLEVGGKLSGVPTLSGTYSMLLQVTDSSMPPQVATGTVSLVIETFDQVALRDGGLLFLNFTVPQANVGAFYQQQLQTNASIPLLVVFQVVDGDGHHTDAAQATLPPGIALSKDGWLVGTPKVEGSFSFNVQATDDGALTRTQELELTVARPLGSGGGGCGALPQVGCSSLPGGEPGTSTTVILGLLAAGLRRWGRHRVVLSPRFPED
jgi:hypothetical protein